MNYFIRSINQHLRKNASLCTVKEVMDRHVFRDLKVSFSEKKYTKIPIYKNMNLDYEVVCICWHKDSEAKQHKHPIRGCLLRVVEGSLMETRYNRDRGIYIKKKLTKDDNTQYMHDSLGTHSIKPLENTVSIHVYSPCGFYDKKSIII